MKYSLNNFKKKKKKKKTYINIKKKINFISS